MCVTWLCACDHYVATRAVLDFKSPWRWPQFHLQETSGMMTTMGREAFSSKFAFSPSHHSSFFLQRGKKVVFLNKLHKMAGISEDRNPDILDYNHNKRGVDNLDKVTGASICRRMTAFWHLVVFHNIIDVSSYNSLIWNKINLTWMPDMWNKRVFQAQLGKEHVTPHIQRRECLLSTTTSAVLLKAVQGVESCSDPPEAAAEADRRRRCQKKYYVLHMWEIQLQGPYKHLHTVLLLPIKIDWLIYVLHIFCFVSIIYLINLH